VDDGDDVVAGERVLGVPQPVDDVGGVVGVQDGDEEVDGAGDPLGG
jgi:hypothetical protein